MLQWVTEDYAVAGQLLPEEMEQVKAMGFASIINNRPDGEEADQPLAEDVEAAAVEAGMEYAFVPVGRMAGQETVVAMAEALENLPKPVLAFCRSGTRSLHIYQLVVGEN